MSDKLRSILFATATALLCSVLITCASAGLKGFKLRNVAVDKQKNILKSVGLIEPDTRYTHEEIDALFSRSIKKAWLDPSGELLYIEDGKENCMCVWLYMKEDRIVSYIIPINTRGLWGKIYGYLALGRDGSTIDGFTVYRHAETPGLGGEIEKRWFQKNFVGKKIVDRGGDFVSVSIAKGKVEEKVPENLRANYVDGISGATLTGNFLTSGFRETLEGYEPISLTFRRNRGALAPR